MPPGYPCGCLRRGGKTGVTAIRSITLRTPRMLSAIFSALSLARMLRTEPNRVTMPWLVLTSRSFGNAPSSNINALETADVISKSAISFLAVAACNGKLAVCIPAKISRMGDHLPIAPRWRASWNVLFGLRLDRWGCWVRARAAICAGHMAVLELSLFMLFPPGSSLDCLFAVDRFSVRISGCPEGVLGDSHYFGWELRASRLIRAFRSCRNCALSRVAP